VWTLDLDAGERLVEVFETAFGVEEADQPCYVVGLLVLALSKSTSRQLGCDPQLSITDSQKLSTQARNWFASSAETAMVDRQWSIRSP